MQSRVLKLAIALACASVGCGSEDDSSSCLAPVDLDCQPAYQPTFDNIFDNRLGKTCGAANTGGSCHSEAGAMGGLVLADKEMAYDTLLGMHTEHAAVIPGDPECSPLAQRIESDDPDFMMPPGSPLSAAERCTILQWIANGAKR